MKAFLDCIPCCLRQALETVRRATDDPKLHLAVMQEVNRRLGSAHLDQTPAALCRVAYQVVAELTGTADPYLHEKRLYNQKVMDNYDHLLRLLDEAPNRLHRALQLAVAGNVIDHGIGKPFDIDREVPQVIQRGFAIDDTPKLEAELAAPGRRNILYMLDNAGEIVFDKLLIDILRESHDVTACVRGGPIINDATIDDARQVGLTEMVKVITTGSSAIGVEMSEASDELKNAMAQADLIISKGQANFETLSGRPENYYFILKAKCDCVARDLAVNLGDVVIVNSPRKGA